MQIIQPAAVAGDGSLLAYGVGVITPTVMSIPSQTTNTLATIGPTTTIKGGVTVTGSALQFNRVGWWSLSARVEWPVNGAGSRLIRMTSSMSAGSYDVYSVVPANPDYAVRQTLSALVYAQDLTAAARLFLSQTSGAALSVSVAELSAVYLGA